jgi:hypothetical protein
MQVSREVRKRLAQVVGNLICSCIENARSVPYLLDQEEVVNILVGNPALFEKLVREEQSNRVEFSKNTLTARLDATKELDRFEALDTLDMSFTGSLESDADLAPILEQINQLCRAFAAYISNTVTVFEREFELFMEKYRQSLLRTGAADRAIDFSPEEMADLEARSAGYLASGQYVQAFLFGRLVSAEAITGRLIRLPSPGYSFTENLIHDASRDPNLFPALVRFILRASYVSQGSWDDLFGVLLRLVDRQPGDFNRTMFVDLIERDAIFTCNLLRESFTKLRRWPPVKRREAIETRLEDYRQIHG